MVAFLVGALCGCILTLFLPRLWQWLSIRVLPAQHLTALPTVRRGQTASIKDSSGK